MDFYKNIEENDLTEDLNLVSKVIGLENVRLLLKHLHGMSVYIPKITRFDKTIKRLLISKPEPNIKSLALELNVSVQYLQNLKKR